MIECAANGWILHSQGGGKYVYTDAQVENYFLNHHFEEIEPYLISDNEMFHGCVTKNVVGVASETFQFKEPEKFTIFFMLGQKTNFL
jgi:hypothetical protein